MRLIRNLCVVCVVLGVLCFFGHAQSLCLLFLAAAGILGFVSQIFGGGDSAQQ